MNLTVSLTPDQLVVLAREVANLLGPDAHLPGVERLPETLTVQQAAAALQLHPRTVSRRVAAGVIPRVPGLGSAIRIPRKHVEKMIS